MVTTIRMPDELHKKLKEEADKKGMTLNGHILSLLWQQSDKTKEGQEILKERGNGQ